MEVGMSVVGKLATKLVAGVLIVLPLLGPAVAQSTAAELTAAFCATRMAGNDAEVKPLLTPALLKLIEEAEQRSQAIAKAQPDEKPPFGDGIPYQSFPDKPDSCVPDEPVAKAGITEAPVTYAIAAAPEASWTDTLILTLTEGKMLIDDIRFQAAADGSETYTLREILADAFDQ